MFTSPFTQTQGSTYGFATIHRCSSLPPYLSVTGLYNDCKGSETDGPHKGSQTPTIPGPVAYQAPSQEEAQVNTQTVVDMTQSLGWITNQEKSELKPTQVFSFMGYE